MRVSSSQFIRRNLETMFSQQERAFDIQQRLASGRTILTPKDDPVGITNVLKLQQAQESADQYIRNGENLSIFLEQEEGVLESVSNAVIRLKELAIQANKTSLTETDRGIIASEMQERLNEIVSGVNTRSAVNGEYMFSGFKGLTQTIKQDAQGVYQYQGDDGVRMLNVSETASVALNDTAREVFFDIDSSVLNTSSVAGRAIQTFTPGGLVNSGSLTALNLGDIVLDDITVPASLSDNTSTTDVTASAIALATAINSGQSQHGVVAVAQTTVADLGAPTLGDLAAGDFTLNGVPITGTITSNNDLLNAINNQQNLTGVTAAFNGGNLELTATDGRNIQVVTDGTTAGATFANFDLNGGGALDQVQQGGVVMYDHAPFVVGGAAPGTLGMTLGTVNLTANTGTATISTPIVRNPPDNAPASYTIVFNALNPAANFDVYSDADPSTPLTGFDDVAFTDGQTITIDGVEIVITGTPNPGDNFTVDVTQVQQTSLMQSAQDLITAVKTHGNDPDRLSYEVGVALQNLSNAETNILEFRAKIGARLNIVDSQKDLNESFKLIAQESISKVMDVDYAEYISALTQQTFALEAAQQSFIRIQNLSLFRFLQ